MTHTTAARDAYTLAERALSEANDTLSRCQMALHAAERARTQAHALVGAIQPLAQAEYEAQRRAEKEAAAATS